MHNLQMLDAWNHAYGIPPDSVEAQRMREPVKEAQRTQRATGAYVLAQFAHFYQTMGADPDTARDALSLLAGKRSAAKPSISGLLVTAGEKWK